MKYSLLLLLVGLSMSTSAQSHRNYRKFRDEVYHPVCGWRDSATAAEVRSEMLAIDTTVIRKNIASYYSDLAHCEFELFAYSLDSSLLTNSALHEEKVLAHDPMNMHAMWGAAYTYGMLGECDKSTYYLTLYIRVKKDINASKLEQVEAVRDWCR